MRDIDQPQRMMRDVRDISRAAYRAYKSGYEDIAYMHIKALVILCREIDRRIEAARRAEQ